MTKDLTLLPGQCGSYMNWKRVSLNGLKHLELNKLYYSNIMDIKNKWIHLLALKQEGVSMGFYIFIETCLST